MSDSVLVSHEEPLAMVTLIPFQGTLVTSILSVPAFLVVLQLRLTQEATAADIAHHRHIATVVGLQTGNHAGRIDGPKVDFVSGIE